MPSGVIRIGLQSQGTWSDFLKLTKGEREVTREHETGEGDGINQREIGSQGRKTIPKKQ